MSKKLDNFPLSLAIFDAVPVLFFFLDGFILFIHYPSILLGIGWILASISGLLKVIWKLIYVIKKKNISILSYQLRLLLPIGFICVIISLFINHSIDYSNILKEGFTTLKIIPFIIFCLGIIGMILAMFLLDHTKTKSNWIEESINSFSQFCLFLFLLLIL